MCCKTSIFLIMLWGAFQPVLSQVEFSIVRMPQESKDSVTLSFRSTAFRSIKAVGFEIVPNEENLTVLLDATIRAGDKVFNFPEKIRVSRSSTSLKVFLIKRRNTPNMYSRGGEILRMTISNSISFTAVMKNWNVMVLDSVNNPMLATFSDTILRAEQEAQLRYAVRYYPNPVSNTLSLETDGSTAMHLQLFDILGRNLIQHDVAPTGTQSQRYQFPMSFLPPGVYFLKIARQNQKDQVVKLLKVR